MQEQSVGLRGFLLAFVIFAVAAGARAAYILGCTDDGQLSHPFQVQDAQSAMILDRRDMGDAAPVTDDAYANVPCTD